MDELLHAQSLRAGFDSFGPTRFGITQPVMSTLDASGARGELRREIRNQCPEAPGVYGLIDRRGTLIYVGKSDQLRQRILTYFYDTSKVNKQRQIAALCQQLVWEPSGHQLLATLRELELIRRWRPKMNVHGQPGRTRCGYVFLTPVEAAHFRVEKLPLRDSRTVWGPVPLNYRTRSAVSRLNNYFRLRDCPQRTPMRFADQGRLFGETWPAECTRGELDTCLAPCTGRCTKFDYAQEVQAASDMLNGTDASPLNELTNAIDIATNEHHVDELIALGETWDELLYLCEQTQFAREVANNYRFVLPMQGNWVLVDHANVAAIVDEPTTSGSAQTCLHVLHETYTSERITELEDLELMRLFVSWCHRHPDELQQTLRPAEAIEHCRRLSNSRSAA